MNYVYFIIIAIISFAVASALSGKFEGDKPERSLRIPIKDSYLHIHHWLYFSVIALILYVLGIRSLYIYSAILGIIMQGLTYKDRFVIFYKKSEYEKIYSRYRSKD